jgi:hypothetical protein
VKHPILSEKVRLQSFDVYATLQRALILDDSAALEKTLQSHLCQLYPRFAPLFQPELLGDAASDAAGAPEKENDAQHSFLLFAAHLYLTLHPEVRADGAAPLSAPFAIALFCALLRHLTRLRQYSLIAVYAAYLPREPQIREYVLFLQALPPDAVAAGTGERAHFLQLAKQFFPGSVLEITRRLVSAVRVSAESDAAQHNADPSATPTEMQAIAALDCFDWSASADGSQLLSAVLQANALFRGFLLANRVSAARELSDALSAKRLDQLPLYRLAAESLPPDEARNWSLAKMELEGWRAMLTAHKWYAVWSAHTAARPAADDATQRLARTPAASAAALRDWENKHTSIVQNAWKSFQLALTCHGGLLSFQSAGDTDGALPAWARALRQQCIPTLVFLLFQLCTGSGSAGGMLSLQIAELVADERWHLYDAFSATELAALLRRLGNAYIECKLQRGGDEQKGSSRATSTAMEVEGTR